MGEIIIFERRSNNTGDSKQEKSKNQSEIYHKAPAWIDKKEENRVDQYQLRRVIKKTLKKFRASPMEREIVEQFIAYLNNSQGQINLADKRYDSAYRYADELGYGPNGIYKGFCGLGRKGVMESHYDHIARRSYRRLSPAFQTVLVADMAEQKNKDEQRRNKRSQIAPSQTGRWHLPKREDGHLPKREYKLNQDLELNNTSLIMGGCKSQDCAKPEEHPPTQLENDDRLISEIPIDDFLAGPSTPTETALPEPAKMTAKDAEKEDAIQLARRIQPVFRNPRDGYVPYKQINKVIAENFLNDRKAYDSFFEFVWRESQRSRQVIYGDTIENALKDWQAAQKKPTPQIIDAIASDTDFSADFDADPILAWPSKKN